MKPTQFLKLISFCLFLLISFTSSAKKEEMKLHLLKGEHFTFLITQESTFQQNPKESPTVIQKTSLKIRQDVIAVLGNGNYVIKASIVNFNLEINYNGKITRYDSDTVNVMNKYYKTLNFLTDIKLDYELSPEGVVSKLTGFEPIKKKAEIDRQLTSHLRSFGNEQFVLELYNYIPLKSIGVGDKWTVEGILPEVKNLKYDIHYLFKMASPQNLTLNREATFNYTAEAPAADSKTGPLKETGTQKGTLLIDPKTSLCLSSDFDEQILIIIPKTDKPQTEKTAPLKITTHTKMLLVKK